jgi:hypothetical protein
MPDKLMRLWRHDQGEPRRPHRQIRDWVQQGVAAELSAARTRKEILQLVQRGVAAELSAAAGTPA